MIHCKKLIRFSFLILLEQFVVVSTAKRPTIDLTKKNLTVSRRVRAADDEAEHVVSISTYFDIHHRAESIEGELNHFWTWIANSNLFSRTQDLQKINSLINQSRKLSVAKRFNIDCEPDYPPSKVAKDSSLKLLISDREEFSN